MSNKRQTSYLEGILFLGCVLMLRVPPYALPQNQNVSWQLNQVKEKLIHAISEKKPEWKHTSIPPMQGSENTIIDQWASDEIVVKVSIVEYASEAEATQTLQRMAAEGKDKVKPQHFGDEGYVWNDRGSLAFREGGLLVYISAVSTKVDDPSVLTETGNEAKVTKEFAKYAADALEDSK